MKRAGLSTALKQATTAKNRGGKTIEAKKVTTIAMPMGLYDRLRLAAAARPLEKGERGSMGAVIIELLDQHLPRL